VPVHGIHEVAGSVPAWSTVHDIGEHRPELLAFAPLNLIEPNVARLPLRPSLIPLAESGIAVAEGPARSAGP